MSRGSAGARRGRDRTAARGGPAGAVGASASARAVGWAPGSRRRRRGRAGGKDDDSCRLEGAPSRGQRSPRASLGDRPHAVAPWVPLWSLEASSTAGRVRGCGRGGACARTHALTRRSFSRATSGFDNRFPSLGVTGETAEPDGALGAGWRDVGSQASAAPGRCGRRLPRSLARTVISLPSRPPRQRCPPHIARCAGSSRASRGVGRVGSETA